MNKKVYKLTAEQIRKAKWDYTGEAPVYIIRESRDNLHGIRLDDINSCNVWVSITATIDGRTYTYCHNIDNGDSDWLVYGEENTGIVDCDCNNDQISELTGIDLSAYDATTDRQNKCEAIEFWVDDVYRHGGCVAMTDRKQVAFICAGAAEFCGNTKGAVAIPKADAIAALIDRLIDNPQNYERGSVQLCEAIYYGCEYHYADCDDTTDITMTCHEAHKSAIEQLEAGATSVAVVFVYKGWIENSEGELVFREDDPRQYDLYTHTK